MTLIENISAVIVVEVVVILAVIAAVSHIAGAL